jgi:HAD superfamily hydrolase (TIGR01490 family)
MNSEPAASFRTAAFFDLDGTLLSEPSLEMRFFGALRQNNAIPLSNYVLWAWEAFRLFPRGIARVRQANKRYLTGVNCDLVFHHVDEIPIFDEGIARIAWHVRQGHEIVLVTGTLEPLAQMAATAIECELEARGIETITQVCATRLEEFHGRWTGRLLGDAMYGEAKRKFVLRFAQQRAIDLRNSFAYGNTVQDSYMLSAVGYAHVVNPNKQHATLANLYDWPVWHWHKEKSLPSAGISSPGAKIQRIESSI